MEEAARRELEEETGLRKVFLEQSSDIQRQVAGIDAEVALREWAAGGGRQAVLAPGSS